MLGENQTKSTEQILEEWEESYLSFNLATIKSPSQLWLTYLALLLRAFRIGKAVFPSVLLHSVFRAVFKAATCFPSQTEQLGLGPGGRLVVQKCDSDLDFVTREGAVLSFLGEERSLAKAFVTQCKCKPQSWRTYSDRRSFGQCHL